VNARAAWLRRRALGIGASDVAALLVALGRYRGDVPGYIQDKAKHVVVSGDLDVAAMRTVPRLLAEKSGLVASLKVGPAALRGIEREGELLDLWRRLLGRGVFVAEHEATLEAASIAAAGPQWIMPLVDRMCPALCATPDAWCLDTFDAPVVVQIKCSYGARSELPWWWRVQVLAEIAVTGAEYGVLVCGEYWARERGAPPGDGPVRSWVVDRDERAIEEIRDAVREGWRVVEELRAMVAAEQTEARERCAP
jgi:hypothetical protein